MPDPLADVRAAVVAAERQLALAQRRAQAQADKANELYVGPDGEPLTADTVLLTAEDMLDTSMRPLLLDPTLRVAEVKVALARLERETP